jgi:hypothetical protein
MFRAFLGLSQPPIQWVPSGGEGGSLSGTYSARLPFNGLGSLSLGVQRPDCDADNTLAFSAKVTNLGDMLPLIHTCMPLWRNLHRSFEVTKHAINPYAIMELLTKVTNRTT